MGFETSSAGETTGARALGLAVALALHGALLVGLAYSIAIRTVEERPVEPRIVMLAPQLSPPPSAVETIGPEDVITAMPRFQPRAPLATPQAKRRGDPALAVWAYLCNRDAELSEAARRGCPSFDFSQMDMGVLDPLNRRGDVGALMGPEYATMSLEEIGRKNRWFRPKHPWPAEGARAKGDGLGLPGHDPTDFLPK